MMSLRATFITAFKALRSNLGRSLLTILGIVIGIVAIVLVISLGRGAEHLILAEVQSIGGNTIIVRPGRQPQGPSDFADTVFADSIKQRDIEALLKPANVPNLKMVAPAVIVSGSVSYQENVYRPTTLGWTAQAMEDMFNISVDQGEYFSDDDIKQRTKVAVIGAKVKEELFGDSHAVGQFITIKDNKIRVVGVLPKLGQLSVFNADELVVLPYSTAQKDILGINHYQEVLTQAKPDADVKQVADDIRATLRETHGLTGDAKDDFFIMTQEDIIKRISTVSAALSAFLIAIASISLVVGGVGIMNIMLVSVTERTHEIGLRKALGATNQDIQRQFLIEAVILTGTGGAIGTFFALTLSFLITLVLRTNFGLNWPFQMPPSAFVLGIGVSTLIGLAFGIYPARQASRKDPITALRYE